MVKLAAPFAQAMLEIAQANGREDETAGEFDRLVSVLKENQELGSLLRFPGLPTEDKQALLGKIFYDESKTFQDFLSVVCMHHMAGSLEEIASEYSRLLDESRHIQNVTVTSAVAMTDDQKERLEKALEKKFGGPVRMKMEIDPSLIGGVKVTSDTAVLDASWAGRLERMKEQLKAAGTGEV